MEDRNRCDSVGPSSRRAATFGRRVPVVMATVSLWILGALIVGPLLAAAVPGVPESHEALDTTAPGSHQRNGTGSLIGQVEWFDSRPIDWRSTQVELRWVARPLREHSVAPSSRRRPEYVVPIAGGPDGSLEATHLEPGVYRITVRHPGIQPRLFRSIEVEAGATTELPNPLLIRREVPVTVRVTPPVDPTGRPWTIEINEPRHLRQSFDDTEFRRGRLTGVTENFKEFSATDEDGGANFPSRLSGPQMVAITDSIGNLAATAKQVVNTENDPVIEIPIAIVPIRAEMGPGILAHPVSVTIRPYFGRDATVRLDPEGGFESVAYRAGAFSADSGTFTVEVTSDSPWNKTSLTQTVAIEEGEVHLQFDYPADRLVGLVVAPNGSPAPGAKVNLAAQGARISSTSTTDQAGRFELPLWKDRPSTLYARKTLESGKATAVAEVQIDPASEVIDGPLILRLEEP